MSSCLRRGGFGPAFDVAFDGEDFAVFGVEGAGGGADGLAGGEEGAGDVEEAGGEGVAAGDEGGDDGMAEEKMRSWLSRAVGGLDTGRILNQT